MTYPQLLSEHLRLFQTMTDLTLSNLRQQKQFLEAKTHKLSIEYQKLRKECYDLEDDEDEELQEQLQNMQENILTLQGEVDKINLHCRSMVEEKKQRKEKIKEFENKKEQLTATLKEQTNKLDLLLKENSYLENSIKISREQYQKCQEEIYDLTIKGENLRKYGWESIPQNIVCHLKEKQGLERKLREIDEQFQQNQDEVSLMVTKDQIQELEEEISSYELQLNNQITLQKENINLKKENERLTQIKIEYEENPNLEIKTLESKLQEEQQRIAQLEKAINCSKKKNKEIVQKINEYKKYLSKQINSEQGSCLGPRNERKEKFGRSKKSNIQSKDKASIYDEIREDLEREKRKESYVDKIKNSCLEVEKVKEELDPEGRTFKKVKRVNILELLITIVVLVVGGIFFCELFYKK